MSNPLQLVRFASVAEHLSFSDAARALGVDQATLSRQIRQLERDLGFSVFQRTTRRVELTPQGAAILPSARDLAGALDAVRKSIDLIASENEARLRFGMHPFVYWSPQVRALLEAFAGRRQDVSVETSSGMSGRSLARLRVRSLDAAVVVDRGADPAVRTLPLMRVEPHLLLPQEHPAALKEALDTQDLAGLRVAIFRPGQDREDYDTFYGPMFDRGAKAVTVSEGAAAVVFHATADRLAMISLRDIVSPPPAGFIRRRVTGGKAVEFVLATLRREDRATVNHFWNCAQRLTGQ
jgi:DNA-binding transcriptional LysR family regulator